jgi:hypothetical protein
MNVSGTENALQSLESICFGSLGLWAKQIRALKSEISRLIVTIEARRQASLLKLPMHFYTRDESGRSSDSLSHCQQHFNTAKLAILSLIPAL